MAKKMSENKKKFSEATIDDLKVIGGLDEKTAQSILKYRDEHGPIEDFDDFNNVQGLGDTTLEDLRRHFSLD